MTLRADTIIKVKLISFANVDRFGSAFEIGDFREDEFSFLAGIQLKSFAKEFDIFTWNRLLRGFVLTL